MKPDSSLNHLDPRAK